jgi:hypothetical protein
MNKLMILGLYLLMVLSSFSQQDTTAYPRVGYPNDVLTDTCILFTPEQAKYAAEDAINADNFKQQLDSTNSLVNQTNQFITKKNEELANERLKNYKYQLIVNGFNDKEALYLEDKKKSERKEKWNTIEKRILYPTIIALIITTVVGFLTN